MFLDILHDPHVSSVSLFVVEQPGLLERGFCVNEDLGCSTLYINIRTFMLRDSMFLRMGDPARQALVTRSLGYSRIQE